MSCFTHVPSKQIRAPCQAVDECHNLYGQTNTMVLYLCYSYPCPELQIYVEADDLLYTQSNLQY